MSSRVPRSRSVLASFMATALVAATVATLAVASPAGAAENRIDFGGGATGTTVGAGAVVRIEGRLVFETECPEEGFGDFVYPATDVYVVDSGSVSDGGRLRDASGWPNTIVATTTIFIEEIIAITSPGTLGEGVYDVVYDTCQDGTYDSDLDALFRNAITVDLPDVLPDGGGAIAALKLDAGLEFLEWRATHAVMSEVFKQAAKAIEVQCGTSPLACAMKQVDYLGKVKDGFLRLLLSQANHYLGIALDPPDPDFQRLTAAPPIAVEREAGGSDVTNAATDAMGPLATEIALTEALLHAGERYQGAQAAGDAEWGLIHARQARDLAANLRSALPATSEALSRVGGALAAHEGAIDAALTAAHAFWLQSYLSGFTGDERRSLLNQGLTTPQINALETEVIGLSVPPARRVAIIQQQIVATADAHARMAAALGDSIARWDAIVADLAGRPSVPQSAPVSRPGGAYSVGEGQTVVLDGGASSTGEGTTITSFAWDLDGDGEFDDATGPRPSVSFPTAGTRLIGLRVGNSVNREALAYSLVAVAETNQAPRLSSRQPDAHTTVVVGSPATFAVTATDAEGGALSYAWTVDGTATGITTPSFTYDPTAGAVGRRSVEVIVSDGTVAGGTTRHSWDVIVLLPDADGDGWTATTDCDEKDPAVHPGANELLGNGVDDDCDPGTADAPPGGLTGSMWGWGDTTGVGNGKASHSNQVTSSPDEVIDQDDAVQVESATAHGWAVRANGEVLAWGGNYHGQLGDGTTVTRLTPVSPLAVGGGSGRLSGVTQLSEGSLSVLARRSDGTVVAWGENRNRQLGDGSTVNHRTYPVQVLAGPDGTPLSGVRAVEASDNPGGSYALMDDGTVRAWGSDIRCNGRTNVGRVEPYPVPLHLAGGEVRQVAAGLGGALILKKDGTVLSCAVSYLGRPVDSQNSPFDPLPVTGLGPGSGVVAVSAGLNSGLALKADGTVWAWGQNSNGELSPLGVEVGPGAGGLVPTPRQVPLPPGPPVITIDNDNASHTLVLRADGSVLAWGSNFRAQTGTGPPSDAVVEAPTVVNLPGRSTIDIAASGWNSLALTRPLNDAGWERPATWVDASVENAGFAEAGGGSFRLTTSFALPHDVTVDWTLQPGTAGPDDVALAGGKATIPAGATSVDISVPTIDDALDEDDETFTIVLTKASHGINLERPQAVGTITDDDSPPSASVAPARVTEGNTSLTDAQLPVTLSGPSAKPITLRYATSDGSAIAPDDYGASTGELHIAPGETSALIHVAVKGDTAMEPEEALTVTLSAPENVVLGTPSAAVTIIDDEALVLSVTSPAVHEGTGGTTPATFKLSLAAPVPAGTQVSLPWRVESLTATVPGDVAPASGTATFSPGDQAKEITVAVQADSLTEQRETFRLVLGTPQASDGRTVLLGDNAAAIIIDDDPSNRPPSCAAVAADVGSLWPANHRMVRVTVAGATDPDGETPAVSVTAVTQDEPVEGLGDGDMSPDAILGPSPNQVQLRAERSGTGDGRVYRLTVRAADPEGAACTTIVTIGSPHDRTRPPLDSGGTFDSTRL